MFLVTRFSHAACDYAFLRNALLRNDFFAPACQGSKEIMNDEGELLKFFIIHNS